MDPFSCIAASLFNKLTLLTLLYSVQRLEIAINLAYVNSLYCCRAIASGSTVVGIVIVIIINAFQFISC